MDDGALKHAFDADDAFLILIELQVASNARPRTVGADEISGRERSGGELDCKFSVASDVAEITGFGQPMYAGEQGLLQVAFVELAHAADAKLVMFAGKFDCVLRG